VGISLLWAICLDELWVWQNGRLIWCLLVAAICLTGSWFVRRQVMALANLGSTVDLFTEVMTERPLDEGVLLVNPPAWRSPVHNTFPAGSEHVALMGEHLFIEELVWDNLRQMRPVLAFTVPSLLSDPGYPYGVHEQTAAALITTDWSPAGFHIFLHDYMPEGIRPHYAGFVYPTDEMAPIIATFGDYTLRAASVELCQRQVSTQFTWQPPNNPAATTSMFVQLLDADGRLIAQSDGPPFTLPPDLLDLPSNWQLAEQRTIYLPEDAPQPTQLLLGIYDYVSGQRAAARDSQQTTLPDNALTLPVTSCKL
jgi:hypothetical protein